MICSTGRCKGQVWLIDLTGCRRLSAIEKPLMEVHGGCDLLTVDLIRCLQERIADSIGQSKVRPQTPGILNIPLPFIHFYNAG